MSSSDRGFSANLRELTGQMDTEWGQTYFVHKSHAVAEGDSFCEVCGLFGARLEEPCAEPIRNRIRLTKKALRGLFFEQ